MAMTSLNPNCTLTSRRKKCTRSTCRKRSSLRPRQQAGGARERVISAYNSLVACPYQFYARHILRLNELDEVQEGIEKRDYGDHVHKILQRFHERYAQVIGHAIAEMDAALRQISEEVFADLLQQDFERVPGWRAGLLHCLPTSNGRWRTRDKAGAMPSGERVRLAAGRRASARTYRPAGRKR